VLNISGWYDEAYGPDGATTNFKGILATRGNEKDPRTQTIIGAWTHGELERTKAGDIDFGPDAKVDYDEIILRWMDHYLKGIENGVGREKRVRIFVMGDNRWRDEDGWPLKQAVETEYVMSNDPDSRIGKLTKDTAESKAAFSEFTSDPARPLTDPYAEFGAHDYKSFAGRDDVLVFDTDVFSKDVEVTGPMEATIYASADVPDFDLWVRVLDVWPDGRAFNLMSPGLDVLRASYRNASTKPELLIPGKIYQLELGSLLTSNVFKAGHRLRVQISGTFAPHFSRNLQTGESEITYSSSQTGHIRIYHDKENPATITLPIIPR